MSTKQDKIYYYCDPVTRDVYHNPSPIFGVPRLTFLGESANPNKKLAADVLLRAHNIDPLADVKTLKPWDSGQQS